MAIPGVFTPVRLDSMVLVDGGVVNNYPVNVARAMGADIIIGVDVQSDLKPANELNSAGSILGQLINLMGLQLYKKEPGRDQCLYQGECGRIFSCQLHT